MKYCKYCGAEIPDNGVCTCAESQNEAVSKTSSEKNKFVVVILLPAIVIIIVLFNAIFEGGYKKPVDQFFKGFNKCDSSMIAKSLPEKSADEFKEKMSDEDLETLISLLEVGYGKNIKISYDIENKDSLSKKEIKDLESSTGLDIKKGYNLTIDIEFEGNKEDKETTSSLTVVKIKGEGWKLVGDVESLLD